MKCPHIGSLPSGRHDAISDVGEIRVGHCTLNRESLQTGVTVVVPHAGDPFIDKVPAAAVVINGFGKSVGLIQVEELGVLETPIALTNTFGVSAVAQAQIREAIAAHPEIGREWSTLNPLVLECNDGFLNDIQALAISEAHYRQAIGSANARCLQGCVGAGRGMSAFELKGGVGTASRRCGAYTVGSLVLANFGKLENPVLAGKPIGRAWAEHKKADDTPEKGSIIMLIATDAPLDARQLRRLALRACAGLARTGSVFGHGSGDIALAFSTAYTVPHLASQPMPALAMVHETQLDPLFHAAADATEQAILHALWHAETVHGRDGHCRRALPEVLVQYSERSD